MSVAHNPSGQTAVAPTAVIGGSGFSQLAGLEVGRREAVQTPFGAPSGELVFGRLPAGERAWPQLVFLPRHGARHTIAPHRVNYRANLWALKQAGVKRIIAFAAVGGISGACTPGSMVVPHQLIDYTWGRPHTFFDGGAGTESHPAHNPGALKHIDFSRPYHEPLRAQILAAAQSAGVDAIDGAVYAVTQGPRLETAAEIERLARDGADIVGMTGMPEAALARELDMDYAAIAMVVNPAAGRGEGVIQMEMISANLETCAAKGLAIVENLGVAD